MTYVPDMSVAELFGHAQANPILHGLRIWGPQFWHRLVEEHGPRAALPKQYTRDCPCEGCVALLQQPEVSAFLNQAASSEELRQRVGQSRQTLLSESAQ